MKFPFASWLFFYCFFFFLDLFGYPSVLARFFFGWKVLVLGKHDWLDNETLLAMGKHGVSLLSGHFFVFLFFHWSLVSFSKIFHDLLLSYGTRYMNGPGSFGSDSSISSLYSVLLSKLGGFLSSQKTRNIRTMTITSLPASPN